MKKRISVLLCVLMTSLCFAGCSANTEATTDIDTTSLEATADFILTNFSQMEDADLEQFKSLSEYQLNYTMMQTGLRVEGSDFIGMINSWQAAETECGSYLTHDGYEVEATKDGYTVTTLAQYEEREATILFSFDKDLNMKSMDVSAKFSTAEILTKAGLNTLLGMGTVFLVLIFLAFLISLMKYIPKLMDAFTKKQVVAVKEEIPAAPVPVEEEALTDDLELVAVITAAIAAQEGTSTDGFVVRSIRRRPSNHWN